MKSKEIKSFGWKYLNFAHNNVTTFSISNSSWNRRETWTCPELPEVHTGIDVLTNDLKRPIQDSLQHLAPVFQDTSLIQELALNKSATAWQPQWLHCIYIGKNILVWMQPSRSALLPSVAAASEQQVGAMACITNASERSTPFRGLKVPAAGLASAEVGKCFSTIDSSLQSSCKKQSYLRLQCSLVAKQNQALQCRGDEATAAPCAVAASAIAARAALCAIWGYHGCHQGGLCQLCGDFLVATEELQTKPSHFMCLTFDNRISFLNKLITWIFQINEANIFSWRASDAAWTECH